MKKNSCKPINPKKYSCYGLKKIRARNLITKKNSCGSKIPLPPHNFSNGPSLMLTKQLRQLKTSTDAVTQRKHQLYKRTKSNSAHRPSISLGRMRASFPLVSTIEQCKHCAVRARKLSSSFCVTLAADFSPPPPPLASAHQPKEGSLVERIVFHLFPPFFLKNQHFCDS